MELFAQKARLMSVMCQHWNVQTLRKLSNALMPKIKRVQLNKHCVLMLKSVSLVMTVWAVVVKSLIQKYIMTDVMQVSKINA